MSKIDMHVHSKYSEHPSDWFLQRLGAKESYTEPEYLYQLGRKRGMDFITITDHNRINGARILQKKHPEEVLIGVESTAYFPEDGCKIHILFYGIDDRQFEEIQRLRPDIHQLRSFIKAEDLAYSVAHATFAVNQRLRLEHVEKLILMFDIFEGINGGRNYVSNHHFLDIAQNLTPDHISRLQEKHQMETMSDTPWIKGFTAGSDDHSGMFIGKTYTLMEADSLEDVLENIRHKKTSPMGRHNDFKSLAFTIYKIAYEFSKTKQKNIADSLSSQITENIFESTSWSLKDKLKLQRLKAYGKKSGNAIARSVVELIEEIRKINPLQIDERLEVVYDKTSQIADAYFRKVASSLEEDIGKGDVINVISNLSAAIPGTFLALPFFTAVKHMFSSRTLLDQLRLSLDIPEPRAERKILWFTDTIDDLNGISDTLKELGWFSFRNGNRIRLITAAPPDKSYSGLPPNLIYLPTFYEFKLPTSRDISMRFPSLLKSLQIVNNEEPTDIYISTPGPIGLLGLLFARLFNIPCTGIYHTDITRKVEQISEDPTLAHWIETYSRWFYSMTDVIKVNTPGYVDLLAERGLNRDKLRLFPSAIDPDMFSHQDNARRLLESRLALDDGVNLLYTGRISKEESLDFLIRIYRELLKKHSDLNLILVGDGPDLDEIRKATEKLDRVRILRQIPRNHLPEIYSTADLFLFPGVTDTCDIAVMEAQACEVPAVVSDQGGPREIIEDGRTGLEARNRDLKDWMEKIESLLEMRTHRSEEFAEMRKCARRRMLDHFNWDTVIRNVLTPPPN